MGTHVMSKRSPMGRFRGLQGDLSCLPRFQELRVQLHTARPSWLELRPAAIAAAHDDKL